MWCFFFFCSVRSSSSPRGRGARRAGLRFAPRQTRKTLHVFFPGLVLARWRRDDCGAPPRLRSRALRSRSPRSSRGARGFAGGATARRPGGTRPRRPARAGRRSAGPSRRAIDDPLESAVTRGVRKRRGIGEPSRREEVRRRGVRGTRPSRREGTPGAGALREAARTSGRGGVRRGGETRARKCRARSSARKNTNTRFCA